MKTLLVKLFLKIILLLMPFLGIQISFAQEWSRVELLPAEEFTVLKEFSGTIYALSENKLYTSTDGNNWHMEHITKDIITPISIEIHENTLYIGTFFNGVYEKSLVPYSNWNQYLNGVAISSFAVHNNEMYLSTFGIGVYKKVGAGWQSFNFNFPTFSYNVSKLLTINNTLHAFAGGNGTYYTFNSTTQLWDYHYFFGNIAPGFITDDALLTSSGIVFIARGNALLRSSDQAQTWSSDATGLLNGNSRILYEGINSIYAVSLIFNGDDELNYTRIQTRNKNAANLSAWLSNSELLEFYTYSICEFGTKIFAATDRGLFFKTDNSLGIGIPIKSEVKVYPIPSSTYEIYFSSDTTVDEVVIHDLQGRIVYRNHFNDKNGTINLSKRGFFMVTFFSSNEIKWQTKILMN